jgi:hypothetical protein
MTRAARRENRHHVLHQPDFLPREGPSVSDASSRLYRRTMESTSGRISGRPMRYLWRTLSRARRPRHKNQWLFGNEQAFGEGPFLIDPLGFAAEAGAFGNLK